jgi:uncharacterized membrane protein YraQ (UPF0718 family)
VRWLDAVGHALVIAGSMTWQILWALIFGFLLSAVVQSVVRRETIVKRLGDERARTLLFATGLGVASSSCSYAAVALARSLFKKGSSFTAAMVFEIASTNLVVELGVILAVLIGWQFTAAEFVGGPIMIVLIALIFRLFLRKRMIDDARTQANKNLAGSMEGHAAMDMSIPDEGTLWHRLRSRKAATSISHIFIMEWAAVIRDIVAGLLIAGAIAAWVPNSFWGHFFAVGHPLLSKIWGPIIGPVVSLLSFVCSIGNVPLAGVLWNGGISFGGVVSFLFADLIILPILVIYKKYYGAKMTLFILASFYVTMVLAGYLVEILFSVFGLVPTARHAKVGELAVQWNYTTALNIMALVVAAGLIFRFIRTGGMAMMKMMGGSPESSEHQHHHH